MAYIACFRAQDALRAAKQACEEFRPSEAPPVPGHSAEGRVCGGVGGGGVAAALLDRGSPGARGFRVKGFPLSLKRSMRERALFSTF